MSEPRDGVKVGNVDYEWSKNEQGGAPVPIYPSTRKGKKYKTPRDDTGLSAQHTYSGCEGCHDQMFQAVVL
jgi:hypothetical protein